MLKRRQKTIIIVLSQYKYLKHANEVFLVQNGRVVNDPLAISSFLQSSQTQSQDSDSPNKSDGRLSTGSEDLEEMPQHSEFDVKNPSKEPAVEDREQIERGGLKLSTLMLYIRAMGFSVFLLIWVGGALMQVSRACFDFWLNDYISMASIGDEPWFFVSSFEVTLLLLMLLSVVLCIYRACIFTYGNLSSAKKIFNTLLPKIIYGEMSFFDKNPTGAILQRFSEDSWSLDYEIPFRWGMLLNNIMIFMRTLCVFCVKVPAILLSKFQ